MTETDLFKKYCDESGLDVTVWLSNGMDRLLKDTYSYKRFELRVAIDELKQAISKALFFWRK